MYRGLGSSELPVSKLVFQLDVSEIKRKFLRSQHKTLISVSICFSSFFKWLGSVEVVATMCPGNIHTALKRQAPLRLLIPRKQPKSDSKTKFEDAM